MYPDRFEEYVMSKKNTVFARYRFNEKVQGANETLEQFAMELKLLVKECDYADKDGNGLRSHCVWHTFAQSEGETSECRIRVNIGQSYRLFKIP